ncbi:MAG: hypothetical protein IT379_17450 [Deltaproteobacteria bacterium]|nr:hypothetical protein [Deltaproteobacteria bacterium]
MKGMSGWWFPLVASTMAGGLLAWGEVRARLRRVGPVDAHEDDVPRCAIADLGPGRFRVVGFVRASESVLSTIDGAACPFLEATEYRSLGGAVPMARKVEASRVSYPFAIDDGSGVLRVDPADLDLEAAVLLEDGGFTTERRIRDGEEVELVATFARTACGGPYREGTETLAPVTDADGKPRLSFRTERGMASPPDEVTWAMRGLAALTIATAAVFVGFAYVIG